MNTAAVAHIALHLLVPTAVALLFFRRRRARVLTLLLCGWLIDFDHLLATPVYAADRCSIGLHPLHTAPAIVAYGLLSLVSATRLIGAGLLIHIGLDSADCLRMHGTAPHSAASTQQAPHHPINALYQPNPEFSMLTTMMRTPLLLDSLLERAGRIFGRVEIVSRLPDRSLHRHTYADFHRRACALGQALLRAGLRKGERVATLSWNHYAHLEAYFGVPLAGGVLHTLNLRLPADDIGWIAKHAGDRFLIVDDVLLPLYAKFASPGAFEKIVVVPLTGAPVPEGMFSYEDFIAATGSEIPLPEKDENDACGLCYTSGTTGRPKGVIYSHRSTALHALASALPDSVGLSFTDVALPVVPMFHANAWGLPYAATMTGAKQVLPGPYLDAESLLDLYERERVTVTGGVPTIWMSILQALEKEPQRWTLPKMRMLVGGSAVPEAMIRRFECFGHSVIQGWGMTETSPLAAISRPRPHHLLADADTQYRTRAKAGVPAPFVDLRIVAEDGSEAPWDGQAMGEIQLRGPWVTGAYHSAEDAADKFAADGWLRTGDVATMDADGFIQITDRTKDLIKSGGEWISSVQIENEIMAHEAVAEAAVIAQPHSRWGERPLAVVVVKPGIDLDAAALHGFLAPRMQKWMLPEGYAFVDQIPRTSTGKFDKRALRERFAAWIWPNAAPLLESAAAQAEQRT